MTDSSAALSIVPGDLELEDSSFDEEGTEVSRIEIALHHTPGLVMIADIGTKALQAVRFKDLKLGPVEVRLMNEVKDADEKASNAKAVRVVRCVRIRRYLSWCW